MNTVYTIGYSGFALPDFLDTLRDRGVTVLADVRSTPRSGYYVDYDKEPLAAALKKRGILYRNYPREFGARQEDRRFYTPEGYLDFECFGATPQFGEGVEKLRAGMDRGYTFCLMCAEKDPITCHRAILVARELSRRGFAILHLMPEGRTCTQGDLEARLLDKFFPDRAQMSLFGGPSTDGELITEAYRLQNAAIGYRIEEEQG